MEKTVYRHCMELCEQLQQEMKENDEIPVQCLSGEIRKALVKVREYQKQELELLQRKMLL